MLQDVGFAELYFATTLWYLTGHESHKIRDKLTPFNFPGDQFSFTTMYAHVHAKSLIIYNSDLNFVSI